MALLNFDSRNVEPMKGFELLPAGWYNANITNSEMKQNKTGTGEYLQLTFTILDGQFKGRNIFVRLNLQHQNPVAVEIARSELATICNTIKVYQINETQQLHGIPLKIKVKIAKSGQYENNEIVAYEEYGKSETLNNNANTPTWANNNTNNIMPDSSWHNNNNSGGAPF